MTVHLVHNKLTTHKFGHKQYLNQKFIDPQKQFIQNKALQNQYVMSPYVSNTYTYPDMKTPRRANGNSNK